MNRTIFFLAFTICCVIAVFFLPAIPQDAAYHRFADNRTFFNIPNFYNVISNIPFIIIGFVGLIHFFKTETLTFATLARVTLFAGVMLIGFGSGYYHWQPSNFSLVWDRIPMAIVFMSFFSIVIGAYINPKWGRVILIPFIMLGIGSVLRWYASEQAGHGDLRLYVLVQFYPMLAIPLIVFLFPASRRMRLEMVTLIVLYAVAKLVAYKDQEIFQTLTISGHSLKHLFAAGAVLMMLQMTAPLRKSTLKFPSQQF